MIDNKKIAEDIVPSTLSEVFSEPQILGLRGLIEMALNDKDRVNLILNNKKESEAIIARSLFDDLESRGYPTNLCIGETKIQIETALNQKDKMWEGVHLKGFNELKAESEGLFKMLEILQDVLDKKGMGRLVTLDKELAGFRSRNPKQKSEHT